MSVRIVAFYAYNKFLSRLSFALQNVSYNFTHRNLDFMAHQRKSEMKSSRSNTFLFLTGVASLTIAVLMFLFARGNYYFAGAIGGGVLGFISIAKSTETNS